jgi:hypothetical protein
MGIAFLYIVGAATLLASAAVITVAAAVLWYTKIKRKWTKK